MISTQFIDDQAKLQERYNPLFCCLFREENCENPMIQQDREGEVLLLSILSFCRISSFFINIEMRLLNANNLDFSSRSSKVIAIIS
jgi:hypothetical protein